MQARNTLPLDTCIVRVLTATGIPVGAGFLVAENYLCTCTHVVADALDIPRDAATMPQAEIHVDFPLVAPGHILTARPVLWQPAELNGKGDIAGLELNGPLPLGTGVGQLIGSADLWQHTFRAFGFPKGYDDGVWASGKMLGRQASGWIVIEDVKQTGYRVEPGFSGTPVWDEQLQGIVGIVVAAERRPEIKAAFVIPVSLLVSVWPAVLKESKIPTNPTSPRVEPGNSDQDRINRTHMLDKVEEFWVKRLLKHSQVQPVQVVLQLEYALDMTNDSLAAVVDEPAQNERISASGKSIIEIFDELGGELLIVGVPGGGKTRLLLELAVALIDRARHNPQEAIPVIFNLSTWRIKQPTLDQWLITELDQRYGVPCRLAQRWVDGGIILPLLDGLDEVEAEARSDCVKAINAYRQARSDFICMAVCCRDEDYKRLNTKLQLGAVIAIRPLTLQEAKTYLAPLESRLDSVREALNNDLALWDILDTPLMLNIVVSAYTDSPPHDTSKLTIQEARRYQLFDDYIAAMLRRSGRSPNTYSSDSQQMIMRLSWLAQQMLTHQQDTFLFEQIDSTWLTNWRWRSIYHIILRISGALLFLITCSLIGALVRAVIQRHNPLEGLKDGLTIGSFFAFALVTASICACWVPKIVTVPISIGIVIGVVICIQPYMPELGTSLIDGVLIGLVFGLPGSLAGLIFIGRGPLYLANSFSFRWRRPKIWRGLGFGLIVSFALAIVFSSLTTPKAGITFGLLVGACCILPVLLFEMTRGDLIEPFAVPKQALRHSLHTTVVTFVMLFCICLLIGTLWGYLVQRNIADGLAFGLVMGIPIGIVVALASGGGASLQHYLLRAVLARSGVITWRYQHFLDYATDRMFLRRVGGGYSFYHRLLMDHFAKLMKGAN